MEPPVFLNAQIVFQKKTFRRFWKTSMDIHACSPDFAEQNPQSPGKMGVSDVCKGKTPEKLPLQTGISPESRSSFSEMTKLFSERKLFVGFGKLLVAAR